MYIYEAYRTYIHIHIYTGGAHVVKLERVRDVGDRLACFRQQLPTSKASKLSSKNLSSDSSEFAMFVIDCPAFASSCPCSAEAAAAAKGRQYLHFSTSKASKMSSKTCGG
jgi:hypothetical protein